MKATFKISGKKVHFNFKCEQCGNCCAVPGYVHLKLSEAREMAGLLKMPFKDFRKKYITRDGKQLALKMPEKGGCIFFINRRCIIYSARPGQCRTFPFWKDSFENQREWNYVRLYCRGTKSIEKEAQQVIGRRFTIKTPPRKTG